MDRFASTSLSSIAKAAAQSTRPRRRSLSRCPTADRAQGVQEKYAKEQRYVAAHHPDADGGRVLRCRGIGRGRGRRGCRRGGAPPPPRTVVVFSPGALVTCGAGILALQWHRLSPGRWPLGARATGVTLVPDPWLAVGLRWHFVRKTRVRARSNPGATARPHPARTGRWVLGPARNRAAEGVFVPPIVVCISGNALGARRTPMAAAGVAPPPVASSLLVSTPLDP